MSDNAAALMVRLDVNQRQYAREMARMAQQTDRRLGEIERRFGQANSTLTTRMSAMGKTFAGFAGGRGSGLGGVAGAIGAYMSGQAATQLTDSATRITNALKVAGLEGEALTAVYDRLFESAQRNSTPIEALVTLYGRAAVVQKELGVSSTELLGFTDNVAMALRVAGTDATTASGALLQLSQALGGGVVRAEEFNSMLEGALPILQAAAAGIQEAGGSVSRLRDIVLAGELSSQAFFRGIEAGASVLEDQLGGAESTVSQAFVRLQNVLTDVAGKMDDGSGASRDLSDALDELGGWIASTDFGPLISGATGFAKAIGATIGRVHSLAGALGELTGADAVGTLLRGGITAENADERVAGAFLTARGGDSGNPDQDAAIQAALAQRRGAGTVVDVGTRVTPITIADYPVGGGGAGGGNGGGRRRSSGGGGGRGGGGAGRANDFERETEQLERRTAAIVAETNAMAGLNPLVDDYGYALDEARARHDLLTAAQESGLTVTPQVRAQIDALASGYAMVSAEANKLSDAQDDARARAEDMRSAGQDAFKGFISDMRNGVGAAEALEGALSRLLDKMLDAGIDSIFTSLMGGGKGGAGGGLMSSISSTGWRPL